MRAITLLSRDKTELGRACLGLRKSAIIANAGEPRDVDGDKERWACQAMVTKSITDVDDYLGKHFRGIVQRV